MIDTNKYNLIAAILIIRFVLNVESLQTKDNSLLGRLKDVYVHSVTKTMQVWYILYSFLS